MKAMILAAGLGTRLRPLTEKKPKALIPVVNRPIIARNIDYLKQHGADRIVVNAHHHYQQVLDYLCGDAAFGAKIEVRVEPVILGTGGGIKNTEDFWDDAPFVVINTDVLTDINLTKVFEHHKRCGALATMVLQDFPPYNKIRLDAGGFVTLIPRAYDGKGLAFTGIHVIEPGLLSQIPPGQFSDIIDCYRGLIQSGRPMAGYVSRDHRWHDVGDIPSYVATNLAFLEEPFSVGPGCALAPSAMLQEWAVIGDKTEIEDKAEIRRSILWEGVKVAAGVRIVDSIVTSHVRVDKDLIGVVV